MPIPIIPPATIDIINAEIAKKESLRDRRNASIPAIDVEIANKEAMDQVYDDFFIYYDGIINAYNDEKEQLDGIYQVDPVTSLQVEEVATDPTNARLYPDPPEVDIKRVVDFDGGNTAINATTEVTEWDDVPEVIDWLLNGFSSNYPTGTLTNVFAVEALTPASTSVTLNDTIDQDLNIAAGNIVILRDSNDDIVVFKVINAVEDLPGNPDVWLIDFEYITEGTILANSAIDVTFTNFTDLERTNKVSTDPDFQPILDSLDTDLQNRLSDVIPFLDAQLTALAANEDPDGVTEITQAVTDVTSTKTFITNYTASTDLSDTGLNLVSTTRTTRLAQITNRISEITNAYTGQTDDYYEKRYEFANNRSNLKRGMLSEIKLLNLSKQDIVTQNGYLQEAIDALYALLP